MYARENGRSSSLQYVPNVGWMARFSLKPNDPAMRAWREGRAEEPPTEDVFFIQPDPKNPKRMVQMDIHQMGTSGVRQFLERGNSWSGRGEYRDLGESMQASREATEKHKRDVKNEAREAAAEAGARALTERFKRPWSTGADFK